MQHNNGAENWCIDWYDNSGSDNETCTGEAECTEYDCTDYADFLDACKMQQCYDPCSFDSFCSAEWTHDMEYNQGTCDEFWEWHDAFMNETSCEDMSFCHAPHDCTEDYPMLEECMGYYCYDDCEEVDSCSVNFVWEGESYDMNCTDFQTMMDEYADNDETCEVTCLEPYDCTEDTGLETCSELICDYECATYNHTTCTVNFVYEEELFDLDCNTFWEEFSSNGDDNETCGMSCEMYYDCADELQLPFCEISTCIDPCTFEGECVVDFQFEGEDVQQMDCETFQEEFIPGGGDDNCTANEDHQMSEGDCLEMVSEFVEGVESCVYHEMVDTCTGEQTECHVSVVVNGTLYEGVCDEIAE